MESLHQEEKIVLSKPRINAKILEKIQALTKSCENGDFSCVGLNFPSISESKGIQSSCASERVSNANRLNIWRMNHRVLVFGQCWGNSTENITRRNNTKELVSFLNASYAGRYMIWCFTDNFRGECSVQRIPCVDFDLGLAHRICCAVKCWLDINSSNVAAFEARNGDEDKMKFLVSCILRHCGFLDGLGLVSGCNITENIFKESLPNANTVRRYVRYFESATNFKQEDTGHPTTLKQLIMTTVPHHPADFLVGMRVKRRDEEVFAIKEGSDGRVYRDSDYVVFNDLECVISDDVQILIYYECNGREEGMARLRINSIFYRQGLYRFVLDDVECLQGRGSFDLDFSIDLVILESSKPLVRPVYLCKMDFTQGIKILIEDFNREFDREIYEDLVASGLNEMVAKFCAFLRYDSPRVDEFVSDLEKRGFRNVVIESRSLNVTNISFSNRAEVTDEDRKTGFRIDCGPGEKSEAEECKTMYSDDYTQARPLNLLKENFELEKVEKPTVRKIISRRKESAKDTSLPQIVVRKPLHWTPLTQTEGTIFSELSSISMDIDYKRFEEMFCEPLVTDVCKVYEKSTSGSAIDGNRLFLVSLSLKHLELKNITPENIGDLVRTLKNPLGLQDLLNVERVYPTHEEVVSLASADAESLGSIERAMLAYSELLEVRVLVDILIFERRFSSEVFLIEKVLQSLLRLYNSVLDSHTLRAVLKAVLEMGNAMNFQYSVNRKKARGFRLSSLYVFNDYRGKNNASLFSFLFQTLESNGIAVGVLFEELSLVHSLKAEELPRICERINVFIEMYMERLEALNMLEEVVRSEYMKFFGFAYNKLKELGCKFKECCLHAALVRRRLGENESKSSNEVLITLSDFLYSMEQNFMLYGEKV